MRKKCQRGAFSAFGAIFQEEQKSVLKNTFDKLGKLVSSEVKECNMIKIDRKEN